MTNDIGNVNKFNIKSGNSVSFSSSNGNVNIDAHYSTDMKLSPPKVNPNMVLSSAKEKSLYSDREATEKLQKFNTDIYEREKKEKANHEFNFKTYFKVFCGVIITAASYSGICKIIRWFKGK